MKRTLYYNGEILTMESEADRPEAVLVEDGMIRAVGALGQIAPQAGAEVEMADLKGHTLLPAFIDAHSHFTACANALLQAPLEEASDFSEIGRKIAAFIKENAVEPGAWVFGKGYDHNQLAEKAHPPRQILDEAAPQNPVVIQHQSGHMGVFNTRALALLGVTEQTQPPVGGMIGARDGKLTGYMEENAFLQSLQKVPMPTAEKLNAAFQEAQRRYASHGIATLQEGMMIGEMAPLYESLLQNKALWLDVVGYVDLRDQSGLLRAFSSHIGRYENRFKIGGYKIFLDGSPQGRTAWMLEPYQNGEEGYKGYGTLTGRQVEEALLRAAEEGVQLLAHCNGDAASHQFLSACAAAEAKNPRLRALRPVMIHAQLLPQDQLAKVAECQVIPSFFIAHIWHWGDVHIENFGKRRAEKISLAGSALQRGIRFTFHQDAPVIQPNMLETVWCAVNRVTKNGVLLGGDERIRPYDALRAVTINAAYQYFEEHEKGSIAPGKRADLVILDQNPLTVPPESIRRIRVLATIKDGKPVYSRS